MTGSVLNRQLKPERKVFLGFFFFFFFYQDGHSRPLEPSTRLDSEVVKLRGKSAFV